MCRRVTTWTVSRTSSRCAYARVDRTVRSVREPGGGQRAEHHRIADAPARLLELRLDEVGELAVPVGTLTGRAQELGEPAAGSGAPVLQEGRLGARDDQRVAGHRLQVEQTHRGGQVLGRHLPALRERPDRVVEVETGVPDRVPDAAARARPAPRASAPGPRARGGGRGRSPGWRRHARCCRPLRARSRRRPRPRWPGPTARRAGGRRGRRSPDVARRRPIPDRSGVAARSSRSARRSRTPCGGCGTSGDPLPAAPPAGGRSCVMCCS